MRVVLAALLLAGCVEAQTAGAPDPGPGYPPKMGDVTGQLGGQPVAWETFDFSIGAFDASASVDHFDGPYRLQIIGYTPGQPQSEVDMLRVSGTFAGKPAAGALRSVAVSIGDGGAMGSVAQGATLVVERIDAPEGSGYGSASGRITASVCPSNPAVKAPCRLFEARFTTRVQFNG
jgi:hypothetical protein